jgi:hypothetical protein
MADPEGPRRPNGIKLAEPECALAMSHCTDSYLISAVCRMEFKPDASRARE